MIGALEVSTKYRSHKQKQRGKAGELNREGDQEFEAQKKSFPGGLGKEGYSRLGGATEFFSRD